jgi:16S rRNA (guanine527-N7)-methyltransferase
MTYPELVSALKDKVTLSDAQVGQLKQYAALLVEWNAKMNLTAIKEEGEIVEKHFLDCLIPAKSLSIDGKSCCDLGTGAGFPGLVWAIAFPSCSMTLVEATGKKCTFLQAVISALSLKNVRILNKRAEELNNKGQFDIVVARALAPLPILIEIALPLLKVHGVFLAMKGSKGREELALSKNALDKLSGKVTSVQEDSLPGDEGLRLNISIEKMSPTEHKYPRSWAEIEKKPL